MKKVRNDKDFLLVGVTGGIGSGKSVVCEIFQQLGRSVLSADLLARELTEADAEIRKSIRSTFGAAVFQPNGRLDRKKLAELVFVNEVSRKRLNAIVHPKVSTTLQDRIKSLLLHQRIPYIVIEAALIFEVGMNKTLDYVLVVDADEKTRIARVMDRDGVSRNEVLARMKSQMATGRKIDMADFVIHNNGNIPDLKTKVRFFDTIITRIASSKNKSV